MSSALWWSGKTDRFLSEVDGGVPSKQREQRKQRYRHQKVWQHFREDRSCTVLLKRREGMRVTGNGLSSITQRVVCQTSEFDPNWGDSAHHHYFYPGLSHQFIPSHLHFCSSLLTALFLSVSIWVFLSSLLHLATRVIFLNQSLSLFYLWTTLASYHTQCKSRCFLTMAYKVIRDLTPAFLSDLTSHSSPFYSFCSSHTKLDVFGICRTHSGTKGFVFAVPSSWHVFLPDFGMALHPHFIQISAQISLSLKYLSLTDFE